MNDRPLSFGEKAVGLSFNPSGNKWVHDLKTTYAKVLDDLNSLREFAVSNGETEKARLFSVAITKAQGAEMWAVKAATWQD